MRAAMKPIRLTKHAREQAAERGATEAEMKEAIRKGSREPAKRGRELCRYNFALGRRGRANDTRSSRFLRLSKRKRAK